MRTCAVVWSDRRITANNCTDQVLGSILGTEAMSVVLKGGFTIMNSTARTANCNTINDHNPDFCTIWEDSQTPVAVMTELRLPICAETKITRTECSCEAVLLCTGMRYLE